ncbi:catechol-2,3-dioxygenase [Neobacillus niacini]|jgi:catechol 2,3-dioxygenase|uniref:VOC family protein n=1 Tax=Neobacillus niacini TaxID=86668 RepID=UPI002787307A|nr:VOC family protein [Neobacillus niacini]MDQ1002742.1 catechol-2,3-dioxygenase [Neobacillus niacini]
MARNIDEKQREGKTKWLILFGIVLISSIAFLLINNEDVKTKQVNYNLNSSPTLGYVELKISDLDTSLRFYQEVIGFKVLTKEESRAVLTADGNTPLLTLVEDKEAVDRPGRTTGLYHFAILLPKRQDLALSLVHMSQSNYPIQGASDHRNSEALYLADQWY